MNAINRINETIRVTRKQRDYLRYQINLDIANGRQPDAMEVAAWRGACEELERLDIEKTELECGPMLLA